MLRKAMKSSFCKDQLAWYAVHTKHRQECRALEHLQNQKYQCFMPTLQREKIVRGSRQLHTEPLFSRYLFVRLDIAKTPLTSLLSTRGVSRLVSVGGKFSTVPDDLIETLMATPQETRAAFQPGERVAITQGPFKDLEAIFQINDGDARAIVLVELMCKFHKMAIGVDQIRKAN